jgi:hypothetical protein
MVQPLSLYISRVRGFWRVKKAKVLARAEGSYARRPLASLRVPRHAKKAARFVASLGAFEILRVYESLYRAQIAKSVVGFDSVYVVYLVGLCAICMQPRESVTRVQSAVDADVYVALRAVMPGDCIGGALFSAQSPSEHSSACIVVDQFSQSGHVHVLRG